jgi:hypothetical protein
MELILTTGSAKVIAQGVVFAYKDKPLEFQFRNIDGHGENFTLAIRFVDDSNVKEPKIKEDEVKEGSRADLQFINFNSALDIGLLTPFLFASNKNGNKLFLCCHVSQMDNSVLKKMAYTILKEESSNAEG